MNLFSSLASSLFTSLTGSDISAELSQAETIGVAAVEVIILLMVIMMIQLSLILREVRK
jgi:hypothetical protein